MSKLKVLEINKQLKTSADEKIKSYNELIKEAQGSIAVVKKLEADMIKKAKEQAEENRLKREQEERLEKERKAAEEVLAKKAAREAQEAEEEKARAEKKKAEEAKAEAAKVDAAKAAAVEKQAKSEPKEEKKVFAPPERKPAAQKPKTQPAAKPPVRRETSQQPRVGIAATQGRTEKKPEVKKRVNDDYSAKPAHKSKSGFQPVQGNSPYNNNRQTGGKTNPKGQYTKVGNKRSKQNFNPNNIDIFQDDARMRGPRKSKRQKDNTVIETKVIDTAIITASEVSVKSLAEKTGKPVVDILKKLMLLGIMATINSEIDFDTAQLVCGEFGITLEQRIGKTAEDVLDDEDIVDDEKDLVKRPPVVTIMGHVDHGKTSLLDAIRKTKVTEGEAGGITQHIGAYTVKHKDEPITFLDTPGHEAFTAMRARGAQATDIAILVVAADDGVKPQTVEAINHAKDADVPIIVAINKIDKPGASADKIKQELTEYSLLAEEWGGDVIMVPVSAKTMEGLDKLLEMIQLVSEVLELKANPNRLAKGTIIEAKLDKGRGPVATVLVTNGTLKVTDMIVAGTASGRIRAMVNDDGEPVEEAGPSIPVEVIGFGEVPAAGDTLHAVELDKLSRKVVEERKNRQKAEKLKNMSKVSLDDLFDKIAEGNLKNLNIVVKADVQGSAEAIKQALEKISNDEVKVVVKHSGVGAIAEADVLLASVANAIIIGFNVRPDNMARAAADRENVDIRLYRVIYDAIEDVEKAMVGMLDPEFKEEIIGHVEVREIFKVSSVGTIAGCYVLDGKINRNAELRLLRDNIVIHEGAVGTLKRFKDDVKEVSTGYECGVSIENYNNIEVGDIIEAFEMKKVER